MKISEIINCIEETAPLCYQESYDNAGLIIGNKNDEVNSCLICLDVTEEVLDEAIKMKCELVIAHHPMIFSGIKKINGNNLTERLIIKAIKQDIAIYAAHTNLDNVYEGVNEKICKVLGLEKLRILKEKKFILKRLITFCPGDHAENVRKALFDAGAGKIGNYDECSFNSSGTGTFRPLEDADPFSGEIGKRSEDKEVKIEIVYPYYLEKKVLSSLKEAHPYEEVAYDIIPLENNFQMVGSGMIGEFKSAMNEADFLKHLKKQFKCEVIKHTAVLNKEVKKVAVCGGSGSFLLVDAINAGADVFVSGDFKYHQFFDADGKIMIADIGHFESEQFTSELFYELIKKKFPTFAVHLSEINTNPVNYLK
jgi:dinuclear metal center YbgI/SA1388 family protein